MKITKIRRLVTFGNYENISLEAEIEEGESVEECNAKLLHKISCLVTGEENLVRSRNDFDYYSEQLERIKAETEELEKKRQRVRDWLAKFNIPVDAFGKDEIPF